MLSVEQENMLAIYLGDTKEETVQKLEEVIQNLDNQVKELEIDIDLVNITESVKKYIEGLSIDEFENLNPIYTDETIDRIFRESDYE